MIPEAPLEILRAPLTEVGEGPAYEAATDTVWWLDIPACRLFECALASRAVRVHALPAMASVVAPVDATRQVLAMDGALWMRDRATGALTLHLRFDGGAADGLFTNDGRVHPSGALWISSMSLSDEPGRGCIHHVLGGVTQVVASGLTVTNSICFRSDGTEAFFGDTASGTIWRLVTDPATGLPQGKPEVFLDGRRGLDGSVVDRDGLLWNARWGSGTVDAFDTHGRLVRSLSLPARQLTCPAFVGAGAEGMLVTSGFWTPPGSDIQAAPREGETVLLASGFRGVLDAAYRVD